MLELIRRVPPEQRLDVIMVDGNGLLHPRRCGAACHLGVLADIPSIGVAKNYYCSIPATPSRDELKDRARRELCGMGDYFFIEDADDGFVYGAAVKSSEGSTNPIYVSVGHRLALQDCIDICLKCCSNESRVPEPIRRADHGTRELAPA
mmetsp:Transcript_3529/g.3413  ORF Transcript_3529/g.3413 Transcript_3529/m.3413 type:complete len:149 (+) Transcript_3529:225-671(+)